MTAGSPGRSDIAANLARFAGMAESIRRLPREIRVGVEACETFREYARTLRPVTPNTADGISAFLTWASALPVVIHAEYPPNLWVIVDGNGRARAAGILEPKVTT